MAINRCRNDTEPSTAVLDFIFVVCFLSCMPQAAPGPAGCNNCWASPCEALREMNSLWERRVVPKSTLGTGAMRPRDTGSKAGPVQSLEGSLEARGESAPW